MESACPELGTACLATLEVYQREGLPLLCSNSFLDQRVLGEAGIAKQVC